MIESGNQTQGRAFPTAAGPKQSDAFAIRHIETKLVENLTLAEALVDGPKLQCHPLMAPLVSPLTIWRWNTNTRTKRGMAPSTVAAA